MTSVAAGRLSLCKGYDYTIDAEAEGIVGHIKASRWRRKRL